MVTGTIDDSDDTGPTDGEFSLRVQRLASGTVRLDSSIMDEHGEFCRTFIADIPIEDLAAFCRSIIAMAGETVAWVMVQGGEDADVEAAIMAKAAES